MELAFKLADHFERENQVYAVQTIFEQTKFLDVIFFELQAYEGRLQGIEKEELTDQRRKLIKFDQPTLAHLREFLLRWARQLHSYSNNKQRSKIILEGLREYFYFAYDHSVILQDDVLTEASGLVALHRDLQKKPATL